MAVDDQYTKSLLHFDGADASTTFTDESGKIWTRSGDTQISTAQKKFGDSSALFDGNGDCISTPSHADFDFGSGNFTIDFWVRATAVGQSLYSGLVSKRLAYTLGSFDIIVPPGTNNVWLYASETASDWTIAEGALFGTLTLGSWAHIALVRSSTNLYCFLNGVIGSTTNVATKVFLSSSVPVYVGGPAYANTYFTGNIDELRFSKGIARWTSDFSANLPTFPYPNAPACYVQSRGRSRGAVGSLNSGISSQNGYEGY